MTNLARVFFVDANLNVMLIDLKANNGSDYLMYDYEFEEEEEEDQGNLASPEGYLIIELIKEGGDLIFLQRISKHGEISLKDSVRVVKRNGEEIKLGQNYGWIDCLLMAKEMVSAASTTAPSKARASQSPPPQSAAKQTTLPPSGSTKKTTKKSGKATTSTTKPKKPTKGDGSAGNSPTIKPISKFAYAAAAAVHK